MTYRTAKIEDIEEVWALHQKYYVTTKKELHQLLAQENGLL